MAPSFLAILLDSVLLALFRIFKKGHIQEFLFGKGLVGGGGGGGGGVGVETVQKKDC